MAIPGASLPPFGPVIEGEYNIARETIRHAFDELYRATQLLSDLATSEEGFATDADVAALQVQITTNLTLIIALELRVDALESAPAATGTLTVYTDATRPNANVDNANFWYIVKNTDKNARTEIIMQGADFQYYHVPGITF